MATKSDIVLLWASMREMYGTKWTSHYKEIDVYNVWINALTGINTPAIKHALESCLITYPDWPPTLPQFRFLCLGFPTKAEAARLIHKPANDNDTLTDNFIRAMRHRIGEWNIVNLPLRELGPIVSDAYDSVLQVYSEIARQGQLGTPIKRVEHG